MPRIEGVEAKDAPLGVRFIYWLTRRAIKRVPEGMKILAHNPKLLRNFVRMGMYVESKGELPSHLRRLAMLKTAMMVGCPF
ncbi:MAG TPA: hypothetical protein VJN21_06985 [Candidatus Acidoferrales bacterium]|nr:hypothetical protein [Candidatus Acidoferrales bacterium]